MASQSPSAPLSQKNKSRPSGQMILATFLTLVILFLWLHLIVALQIEVTGRKIQSQTAALEKTRREIVAMEQRIATAQSEKSLASRARALGYQPQAPIYLLLPESLSQPGGEMGKEEGSRASTSIGNERAAFQTLSLWARLAQRFGGMAEAGVKP